MSILLGFATLGFLLLLLLAKMLSSLELRSREADYRHNQARISDLEQDLDTSRRKYLIAIKGEGVAKYRLSQGKTKLASLRQHLEQLQKTAAQHAKKKKKDQEQRLEGLVMQALGGPSVRRDSQFKRVMKVIRQLVDLEKDADSEQVMAAIQEKIAQLGRQGLIEAAEKGGLDTPEPEHEPEQEEETAAGSQADVASEAQEEEVRADDGQGAEQSAERRPPSRRDLVRDAIVKKR